MVQSEQKKFKFLMTYELQYSPIILSMALKEKSFMKTGEFIYEALLTKSFLINNLPTVLSRILLDKSPNYINFLLIGGKSQENSTYFVLRKSDY